MTQNERWNIYGSWFMIKGSWLANMVHGSWFMVKGQGLANMVHGSGLMVNDTQFRVNGLLCEGELSKNSIRK